MRWRICNPLWVGISLPSSLSARGTWGHANRHYVHLVGTGAQVLLLAVASLLSAVIGLAIALRKLDDLEYETFMQRR